MFLEILCASFVTVLASCLAWYVYIMQLFKFWGAKGVVGPKPIVIHGNWRDCVNGALHPAELARKIYDEYPDQKMVGIFINHTPALIMRDPKLIKTILATDFDAFPDRGMPLHPKIDPLSRHLFTMDRTLWEPFWRNLSPAFSPSKMKDMSEPMKKVADRFVCHLEGLPEADDVECIKLMEKYATEVVGCCAFGIEMDELSPLKSNFALLNQKRKESSQFNFIRRFLRDYIPFVYNKCSVFRDENKINYYLEKFNAIKKFREMNDIRKQDYVGMLIQMKEKMKQIGDVDFDDELLAAQVYLYFTAGGDSTAIVIANAMYEIAKNDAIQSNLRKEIENLDIEGGVYEYLTRMTYLHKIFQETLRKYPLRNIHRRSSRTYQFPGTDVTIPGGIDIIICHYAIHQDPTLYENPELFDPERFESNPNQGEGMIFLPFGGGRRYCIGSKVAEMMFKTIIVSMVKRFRLRLGKTSTLDKTFARKTFMEPISGIHLKFERIL